MLASISEGTTRIKNLLLGDDCLRSIEAFRAMGVRIEVAAPSYGALLAAQGAAATDIIIHGVGLYGLKKPAHLLYLGNSGTTMRILPGILAGQDFQVVLKGDSSLSKRPMMRIARPLRKMGARVVGSRNTGYGRRNTEIHPPLKIKGGKLKAITYKSKVASAQVKSCILLAGLFAKGTTSVTEPVKSRDHTERMLKMFGVKCQVSGLGCQVKGPARLKSSRTIEIPGDISSAAFFIVAGCVLPNVKVVIENVGLNPTRTGILDVLKKMGADIRITKHESRVTNYEPRGDIITKSSKLKGVTISSREVVRAIDEIPIIMLAACLAKGPTVIKGVGELRVKETDRIKSMVTNLRKMGGEIKVKGDRLTVRGGKFLHGARVSSYGDHRTAMSMLTAGLFAKGKVIVTGLDCINKSFPDFLKTLKPLTK